MKKKVLFYLDFLFVQYLVYCQRFSFILLKIILLCLLYG